MRHIALLTILCFVSPMFASRARADEPVAAPATDVPAPQPVPIAPQPDVAATRPDVAARQPDVPTPQPDVAAAQPVLVAPQLVLAAPPPGIRVEPRPQTRRRKALLITGGVLLSVGGVLTAIGAALYVSGKQTVDACNNDPNAPFLCGLGGAIDQGMGESLLISAAPHFAAGIITIALGAADHR